MPAIRRVVFVSLLLGLFGCRGNRGHCPDGMQLDKERSHAGKVQWCKSEDGKQTQWIQLYPDGKPMRACTYAEGVPTVFRAWYNDGKLWVEGQYRYGYEEEVWTVWSVIGKKSAKGEYRGGRLVGGAPVAMHAECRKMVTEAKP